MWVIHIINIIYPNWCYYLFLFLRVILIFLWAWNFLRIRVVFMFARLNLRYVVLHPFFNLNWRLRVILDFPPPANKEVHHPKFLQVNSGCLIDRGTWKFLLVFSHSSSSSFVAAEAPKLGVNRSEVVAAEAPKLGVNRSDCRRVVWATDCIL